MTDPTKSPNPASPKLGIPGVGIAPSWEYTALIILTIFFIAFGGLVLKRSALGPKRMTDAGVFFRAGWAVREGVDPYSISDNNDWRYLYAPIVAAGFVPLADSPSGEEGKPLPAWIASDGTPVNTKWTLPYPVLVVIWYALSVLCAVLSVHWIAQAICEGSGREEIRGLAPSHGGWWTLRFWPLFLILPDLGSTLSKGQISCVMLACIAGGVLALVRERRVLAGLLLGAGAVIKVFPGLLIFDVFLRRGGRTIAGYILCGILGMVALPAIAFGPQRAFDYTTTFVQRVLLAGVAGSEERLQAGAGFDETDNQAIQGALHNLLNINTPRGQRPSEPEAWIKPTHIGISLAMLACTMLIGRTPRGRVTDERRFAPTARGLTRWLQGANDSGVQIVLRIGMLCCIMLLALPMCHRHYYVFMLPALSALIYLHMLKSKLATFHGWGWVLAFGYPAILGVARVQHEGPLRDLPICPVINIIVWTMCARALWKLSRAQTV